MRSPSAFGLLALALLGGEPPKTPAVSRLPPPKLNEKPRIHRKPAQALELLK